MSRRHEEHNGRKIALGAAMSTPMAGLAAATPLGLMALSDLMKHPRIESQGQLDHFIFREGLKRQVGDKVKLVPGKSAGDFMTVPEPDDGWRVHIGTESPIGAMHEIGHTQAANPVSALRRWSATKSKTNAEPMMEALAEKGRIPASLAGKTLLKNTPMHWLDSILAPVDEAVAWKNALKMPVAEGRRLKMLKVAAPAYASYLAKTGMTLGGLGLVGAGLYGALHKKENE